MEFSPEESDQRRGRFQSYFLNADCIDCENSLIWNHLHREMVNSGCCMFKQMLDDYQFGMH